MALFSNLSDLLATILFVLPIIFVNLVCAIIAYIMVVSKCIQIVARSIFAPMAVVNLFEEG